MTDEWFYQHRGRVNGPVSLQDLRVAIWLGFALPTDLVRRRVTADWAEAETFAELREALHREGDDIMKRNRGAGFTLVELLVVIAIIGVLVGLLVPAVQSAREAGRRIACSNHVKQIALAFHSHVSSHQILPDGGEQFWVHRSMSGGRPRTAPHQNWSWPYQILPFMEQESTWLISDDSVISGLAIDTYFCPSRRSPQVIEYDAGPGWPSRFGAIDYAANGGTDDGPTGIGYAGNCGWGMLGNGRDAPVVRRPDGSAYRSGPVRLAQLVDGASKTLLLGEKCLNIGLLGQDQTDDTLGWCEGWDWDSIRWGYFQPAADWNDSNASLKHAGNFALHSSFGSSHPQAFVAANCDGAIRQVRFDVDLDVFKAMCSRNDGRVVSDR
jgi:prepilin-type N-terminal cleavage/methylation domain-containing protein